MASIICNEGYDVIAFSYGVTNKRLSLGSNYISKLNNSSIYGLYIL